MSKWLYKGHVVIQESKLPHLYRLALAADRLSDETGSSRIAALLQLVDEALARPTTLAEFLYLEPVAHAAIANLISADDDPREAAARVMRLILRGIACEHGVTPEKDVPAKKDAPTPELVIGEKPVGLGFLSGLLDEDDDNDDDGKH